MHWNWKVKLKLLVVLGGTIALFSRAGFWAIPRRDPEGPLVLGQLPAQMQMTAVVLLAGMAAICATVGALWLHRELPGVGWLIVGAGWLGLALRSPGITPLMIYVDSAADTRWLYLQMLRELLLLSALTLLGYSLSNWACRMVPQSRGPGDSPLRGGEEVSRSEPAPPAGSGRARASSVPGAAVRADSLTDLAANFVGTAVLGALLYLLLASGSQLHGQVLFALGGGFLVAGLASHQVFPTRSPWGLVAAVPASAALAYLFSLIRIAAPGDLHGEAPLKVGRALPLDFLGMALPAVMVAYLISFRLVQLRYDNLRRQAEAA